MFNYREFVFIFLSWYLYFYRLHLFPLNAFEYKKKKKKSTTGKLKKPAGCFGSVHGYVIGPICIKRPST